jgi:predicted glycogen debranching enzyme
MTRTASAITFGRQTTGSLDTSAAREWLVTDGRGGFAMGTISGLRTRRYHGLLVVATSPPGGRMLGLVALDAAVIVGDARIALATHEWADGTIAPRGFENLSRFDWNDGVPRWRWSIGDIVVEAEVAMTHGRPAVGVVYRIVAAPRPVRLELTAVCTWRDVHGERFGNGDPSIATTGDGFVFEDAYRVRGPGFDPSGASWWRGDRHREEAARGLNANDDVWRAGTFVADVQPGDALEVEAWADYHEQPMAPATEVVASARRRARDVMTTAALDDATSALALAADQFIVEGAGGPTVVAGYPWFGDWSRDTMTSYEGLFLCTNRWDEGRVQLERAAATLSEGMLANTADAGGLEYNTADATPWFLHALSRHADVTGDADVVTSGAPAITAIVDQHVAGTRFGIRIDADGLLTQGADGWALTWMDARINGEPVTPRVGKPVEINALWVSGLISVARVLTASNRTEADRFTAIATRARDAMRSRFPRPDGNGLLDIVDPDDASLRPNQLLAASLPDAPFADAASAASIVRACAPLVTSLGLRSLAPSDERYIGRHRGGPAERDHAYHQGTVWPWLVGPYLDARRNAGLDTNGFVDGLIAHIADWGIGSVSETADGDVPHDATGCPFQAWSVAELIRSTRRH